jgi:hypothetical protein
LKGFSIQRFNNSSIQQFLGVLMVRLLLLCFLLAMGAHAKTRWSSLHLVPDADFLSGGQYVLDAEGYYFNDSAKKAILRPTALATIGIIEWVNIEAGYAGGPTFGFKARLLGEGQGFVPSLAIGARNIMSGREANNFNSKDSASNEFYLAMAKSVESLRMRIHLGVQTMPQSKKDKVDPFGAIEEYFGNGLYATAEVERLKGTIIPSLYVSYRLFKKKLEISAGAMAINKLFFDKNNKFSVSLTSPDSAGFVKPGLWAGIRYCGAFGFSKNNLFMSVDDKVAVQHDAIESMHREIDSLKMTLSETQTRMAKVDNSLVSLSDSVYSDKNRFRAALYDKLIALKTMYETEPFDAEQTRQLMRRITALKESAISPLKEFTIDKKQDRSVRLLSITLLGEMGGTGASDVLLDVLSQSEDPGIKIEILIALGKLKETRAVYVMEQLANDPIDVVAFTAQEVLMKLVREKGILLSPDFKMRAVSMPEQTVIKDEKIPLQRMKTTPALAAGDSLLNKKAPSVAQSFSKKTNPADSIQVQPKTKAAIDTSKAAEKSKGAADDVWGIRNPDSAQTAGDKGIQHPALSKDTISPPQSGAVKGQLDSTALRPDSTSAPIDSAGNKNVAKNAPAQKKGKSPKKAKEPKKKIESLEEKNW